MQKYAQLSSLFVHHFKQFLGFAFFSLCVCVCVCAHSIKTGSKYIIICYFFYLLLFSDENNMMGSYYSFVLLKFCLESDWIELNRSQFNSIECVYLLFTIRKSLAHLMYILRKIKRNKFIAPTSFDCQMHAHPETNTRVNYRRYCGCRIDG